MRILTILAATLISCTASAADHPLAGTWKLISVHSEIVATGEKVGGWGPKSEGLMSIQPDGKSFTVMVPEDPKMPLNANASTHRLTGESQTTIHRELSAVPSVDQVRNFKIEGKDLYMSTVPVKGPDGRETRSVIHWTRLR
jgi:hypothetical protein